MSLFTASARARRDNGRVDVIQMVVSAYDSDHAIILLTDAIERYNHRTRWRQDLPDPATAVTFLGWPTIKAVVAMCRVPSVGCSVPSGTI